MHAEEAHTHRTNPQTDAIMYIGDMLTSRYKDISAGMQRLRRANGEIPLARTKPDIVATAVKNGADFVGPAAGFISTLRSDRRGALSDDDRTYLATTTVDDPHFNDKLAAMSGDNLQVICQQSGQVTDDDAQMRQAMSLRALFSGLQNHTLPQLLDTMDCNAYNQVSLMEDFYEVVA
jgi:hypothetical protein